MEGISFLAVLVAGLSSFLLGGLAVLAAFFTAEVLGPHPGMTVALGKSLGIGLFFVGTSYGINYLFGGNSLKLWLVNAGYHIVQFLLYGLVFGLWPVA